MNCNCCEDEFKGHCELFPIASALRTQFSWTHYHTLIRIENGDKRDFYIAEADKNDAVVKITLPENNKTIIASKYQLYLPTEQQLIDEVRKEMEKLDTGRKNETDNG